MFSKEKFATNAVFWQEFPRNWSWTRWSDGDNGGDNQVCYNENSCRPRKFTWYLVLGNFAQVAFEGRRYDIIPRTNNRVLRWEGW